MVAIGRGLDSNEPLAVARQTPRQPDHSVAVAAAAAVVAVVVVVAAAAVVVAMAVVLDRRWPELEAS